MNFVRASQTCFTLPNGAFPSGNASAGYFVVFTNNDSSVGNAPSALTDGTALIGGGQPDGTWDGWEMWSRATQTLYWGLWSAAISTPYTTLNSNTIFSTQYNNNGGGANGIGSMVVNGTTVGRGTGWGPRTQTSNNNYVGSMYRGTQYAHSGTISEVLVYSNALTTQQQQQIEAYLAQKWNFIGSLPQGHVGTTATLYRPVKVGSTFTPLYKQFSPLSIQGCVLWLDGADPSATGVLPTSGTTVATWVDKSGKGNNGTSIGNAGSALWSSNSLNGYPTIIFDGATGSYSGTITTNSGSTLSMFVVAYINQGTSANNYPRLISLAPSGAQDYASLTGTFLGRNVLNGNPQSIMTYRNVTILSYQAITYGTPFLASSVYTGSSNTTYANGTTAGAGASSGNFGYNTYNIGRIAGGVGFNTDSTLLGAVSEVIVYSTALTDTQRQTIESYLAQKWGLASTLPTFAGPTSIPGCVLWLDGNDTSTMTFNGSAITQWNDKSGSGNYVSQATLSNAPTLGTSQNGLNTVYFATNNQQLVSSQNSATSGNASRTVIALFWCPTSSSSFYMVTGTEGGSTPPTAWGHCKNANADVDYPFNYGGNGESYTFVYSTPNPILTYCQFNSAAATMSNYYSTTGSGADSTIGNFLTKTSVTLNTTAGVWYFGKRQQNGTGSVTSHLMEMIQYNSALTSTQRQQVEGYLAAKWGIQVQLPNTHPYYPGGLINHINNTQPAGLPTSLTLATVQRGTTIAR